MFFIDHDQPDVFQGRKYCRTCSDDDLSVSVAPVAHFLPLIVTFSKAELAVEHRHFPASKTPDEPIDDLTGQGDFRNQNDHISSLLQNLLRRPDIDFCLSASRNAVQ